MISITGPDIDSVYIEAAKAIMKSPIVESRRLKSKEVLNAVLVVEDINKNLVTITGLETHEKYAKAEFDWYMSGTNRMDGLGKYAKNWSAFSDDGITVNSAYGYMIFGNHPDVRLDQWAWCRDKLATDNGTRQAVINVNLPAHKEKPTRDLPCTLQLLFNIRDGKLNMTVVMRSNDLYWGFRNDAYCFMEIQKKMAHEVGVEYGTYTHFAVSLHIYEKDFDRFENALVYIKQKCHQCHKMFDTKKDEEIIAKCGICPIYFCSNKCRRDYLDVKSYLSRYDGSTKSFIE